MSDPDYTFKVIAKPQARGLPPWLDPEKSYNEIYVEYCKAKCLKWGFGTIAASLGSGLLAHRYLSRRQADRPAVAALVVMATTFALGMHRSNQWAELAFQSELSGKMVL